MCAIHGTANEGMRLAKLLPVGRILFAISVSGFGVLCIIYVDFVHQLQPVDELLPTSTLVYSILAVLTGVFLVVVGPAIVTGIKAYPATATLTAFFATWIVVLQVPSAFIDPSLLRSPWLVRTFETVALGGAALILAGMASRPERTRWMHIGRALFGVSLPIFGTLHFIYAENVASLVPALYPWPFVWAYVTGAGNFAAGLAIITGVLSRIAAILAGVMYGTYALTLHIPRAVMTYIPNLFAEDLADFQRARGGLTSMFVAIGMWGAAWIVAGSLAERSSSDPKAGGEARTPEGASEPAPAVRPEEKHRLARR